MIWFAFTTETQFRISVLSAVLSLAADRLGYQKARRGHQRQLSRMGANMLLVKLDTRHTLAQTTLYQLQCTSRQ